MAVINSGLVPKTLAGGLAGSPGYSAGAVQAPVQAKRGRRQAALPSSAKRLLSQVRAMGTGLAAHNCGGTAFHNGSAEAYPVGRR